MKRLGTDYVEIGMIHYVDSEDDWERVESGEVMRWNAEGMKDWKDWKW